MHDGPAGPSATHGLATVFHLEAVLDLKATGLKDYVDSRSRTTYVEGKHKRLHQNLRGTLVVEGDACLPPEYSVRGSDCPDYEPGDKSI